MADKEAKQERNGNHVYQVRKQILWIYFVIYKH